MGIAGKLGQGGGIAGGSAPPLQGGGFPGAAQPGAASTPPGYPQVGGQASQGSLNTGTQYGQPPVQGGPSQGSMNTGSQYGQPPVQGGPSQGSMNTGSQYGQPTVQGGPSQGSMNTGSRYGQPPVQAGSSQSSLYSSPQQAQQSGQAGQYGGPASQGQTFPSIGGQGHQQYGQQGQQFGQQGSQYGQQGQQFGQQGQFGNQGQSGMPGFGGPPGQYGGGQQGQYGMQQGQYGARSTPVQGQASFTGGSGIFSQQAILQKLQQLVTENRLQAFYPPQKLDQLAGFIASKDVAGLGTRWRLPREVTLDLVGLALYDICIYVDDSGSMLFEEGGERIEDLKSVLGKTAEAACLFDTDGIVVRFMNSQTEGNGIHSEPEATALVQQIRFSGTTPLGTSLDRKVLQPMVLGQARQNCMAKPVLVICITDGEPTGEPKETTRNVVINAKNQLSSTQYGPGAVAFQFAQVGKDAAATRFLEALDTDPVCGKMIDSTSYFEQEQEQYARKGINLDPGVYLVKLMVGAIDRSYDEMDEG